MVKFMPGKLMSRLLERLYTASAHIPLDMRRGAAALATILLALSILLAAFQIGPGAQLSGTVDEHQDVYIPIDVKPAHDVYIDVNVKALSGGHFEVSLLSENHAYIKGEDFILKSGESRCVELFYYFTGNASKAYIRIAASDGKIKYDVGVEQIPRFDDGLQGDAPDGCEQAPVIGSVSGNGSGLSFRGFLTGMYDTDRGLDQSDYYKIHVKTSGEAMLKVTAYPVDGSPRLGLTAIWGGYAIDSDEAEANNGSVSVKVKYVEAVEGDLCLRVYSAHVSSYQVNLTLVEYTAPPPPPEHPPIQPPSDFLPHFWILVILLILLFLWIVGAKPVGPLARLNEKIEKAYLKFEAMARKVMRCEEPAPIKPAATRAIAKFLVAVFLASAAAIEAWIAALGLLPGALLTSIEQWYRALTYWMLHANVEHIVGNLAFFLTMAPWIEHRVGRAKLFMYFILPLNLGAVLAHLAWSLILGSLWIYAIGASGAISGIAGMFYVLYPGKHFIILGKRVNAEAYLSMWFALNLIYAFLDVGGGVAYFAHVGGFLAGLGVGAYERRAA